MSEVFKYIFNNIEKTDKALRKQSRMNRNVVIFAIVTTACIVAQAKKIDELDYEIGKLKRDLARKDAE